MPALFYLRGVVLVLIAIMATTPAPLLARDFHVSTSHCSSDTNDGHSATCSAAGKGPWRTLRHAFSILQAGDSLHLAEGTWNECALYFQNTGKKGAPITIVADKPGAAVIDGKGCSGPGGIILDQGKGHFVFDGLRIQNMPGNGLATDDATLNIYENVTVLNSLFRGCELSGLELAAVRGFVVQGVKSEDNGFYGANIIGSKDGQLSSSQGRILESSFDNNVGPEGHGLAINQGHDISIEDCSASHNRIHGFDVSDWPKKGPLSHDVRFARNTSNDNGKGGFAVNSDSSHVVFVRNLASGNGAKWADSGLAPGFWCYEGCRDISWINNTAVGNSLAGFQIEGRAGTFDGKSPATQLQLINNISWDNGVAEWDEAWALFVSKAGWKLVLENNDFGSSHGSDARCVALDMVGEKGKTYTGAQLSSAVLGKGAISTPPQFKNPSSGDFRLSRQSPLIDAGAPAKVKHCGKAPDIGAFENCP